MQNLHTHNMLHVKREIRPADYKDDEFLTVTSPRTGKRVTIPVILYQAILAGEINLRLE